MFVGSGVSISTALEGRLKLLEIAYAPSLVTSGLDGLTLECLGDGSVAIFICPSSSRGVKRLLDQASEANDNGLKVIMLTDEGGEEAKEVADEVVVVPTPPELPEIMTPIPFIVPLQLFAYYVSVERGLDPDKPRNLAKSVTVK